MVRNYIPKRLKTYTKDDLDKARKLVQEDGVKIKEASRKSGIPYATLIRWVRKEPPSRFGTGRFEKVLSNEEEELIIVALEQASRMGWPCRNMDARQMVKTFLNSSKRVTVLKDNVPGKEWLRSFKRRWQHRIIFQQAEISKAKKLARIVCDEISIRFFSLVHKLYSDVGLPEDGDAAERIFIVDETDCSTDPSGERMFYKKGSRDDSPTCKKGLYTCLIAGNAAGEYLPPLVVYKGKSLYENWTLGGPTGCKYACTDNGWLSDTVFENWFCETFVKAVAEKTKPVVVFVDGYGAHLTYKTVCEAERHNIHIICLPSHRGDLILSLDCAIFKPLHNDWRNILLRFFKETQMLAVTKGSFPILLKQLCEKLSSENLVDWFQGVGLWPFSPDAIAKDGILGDPSPLISDIIEGDPPKKLKTIINSIAPPTVSNMNLKALLNSQQKGKKVICKPGEVLTTDGGPLRTEKLRAKAKSVMKNKKVAKIKIRIKKTPVVEKADNEDKDGDDESDAKCKFCPRWWSTYKGKKNESWVQCDLCNDFICPKCIPKDIDKDDDYFCKECSE